MFSNSTPFFASCICNKMQYLENKFQNNWKDKCCNSCNTKLIVYSKEKVVFNFNEGMYLATCNCNKVKFMKNKIIDNWYSRKCNSCNSNVRVYNDKHIEIKEDKTTKKIFNCSCECGDICYFSNVINLKWPQEQCSKCFSKLILKDKKNEVICNFNFESFNLRSECLFTSVCLCGSLHYQCNFIKTSWKNKKCELCKSSLVVYHSIRKSKLIDYNFETSKSLDAYLEKMESIPFASLAEIENSYRIIYDNL